MQLLPHSKLQDASHVLLQSPLQEPVQSLVHVDIDSVSSAKTGITFPDNTAIMGNISLPEFLKNSRRDWMSKQSFFIVMSCFVQICFILRYTFLNNSHHSWNRKNFDIGTYMCLYKIQYTRYMFQCNCDSLGDKWLCIRVYIHRYNTN